MRVFWDININEKTAELKNEDILLKFIYDLELMGDGTCIIKKIATLEKSELDAKAAAKIAKLLRILGDEFKLLHLTEKVEFLNETDDNDVKMYKIEDNIYVSQHGEICLLTTTGFEDTDYQTAITNIDENIPKNLIKSIIYDSENIKYNGHIINTLAETIDNIRYFEFDSSDFENDDLDDFEEQGLTKEDGELLINDECNILKINDTKLYIYDAHSSISSEEDIKAVELLEILEEVLYDDKMEFLSWKEVLENI